VTYRLDSTYAGKLEALSVKSLDSMSMDPEGNLILGDRRGGSALKVDPSAKIIGRSVLQDLQAVTVDRRGTQVLAGGGVILVGSRQQPLVRPDASAPRPVKEVAALAVDRDGRILVGDAKSQDVLLYGHDLEFKAPIHHAASGRLASIQVGLDNQVYILDSKEKSVSVYADGKSVAKMKLDEPPASIALPLDLAVDELGDLYVVDGSAGRVVVLDPSGKRILATLLADKSKGGLADPQRVEVDRQGRIYIYDRKDDAILRFN
jgi:streptogramin lyase